MAYEDPADTDTQAAAPQYIPVNLDTPSGQSGGILRSPVLGGEVQLANISPATKEASSNFDEAMQQFSAPNTVQAYIGAQNIPQAQRRQFGSWKGTSIGKLSTDSKERIQQVYAAALNVYSNDPVRARLATAQALLESGTSLNSGLARNDNNFFGIKGIGTAGSSTYGTKEFANGWETIQASFAKNATPEDSFLQHKEFLSGNRYKGVMLASTFDEAAVAIKTAGYATDPDYAQKLIAINNRILSPLLDNQPDMRLAANSDAGLSHVTPKGSDLASLKRSTTDIPPQEIQVASSTGLKGVVGRFAKQLGFNS